jgi:biofilm PGA synthesis N-glycosyltransferase PgaC
MATEQPKRKLALLIPAHNEQLVLGDTIKSALRAGLPREDIYVVSDGSTDWTVDLAYLMLPDGHVLDQSKLGKGLAIANGIYNFRLIERYEWVHLADADGVFTRTYFRELKSRIPDLRVHPRPRSHAPDPGRHGHHPRHARRDHHPAH